MTDEIIYVELKVSTGYGEYKRAFIKQSDISMVCEDGDGTVYLLVGGEWIKTGNTMAEAMEAMGLEKKGADDNEVAGTDGQDN